MKTSFCVSLVLVLVAVGCDKSSTDTPASTNASAGSSTTVSSVATAPVDYLGALGRAQQSANKTVDTAALTSAIQQFAVDKGRNPKDLDELVQEKYIPLIPKPPYGTKFEYDAASGKVSVVKQ